MTVFDPLLSTLPAAQRAIWPSLRPAQELGFVLYGGTAVALRLGHRVSLDFDFFTDRHFTADALRKRLPILSGARTLDAATDTLTVSVVPVGHDDPIKLSFFGGIDFGRVDAPSQSRDGVLWVASLLDLMATKLKVLHDRVSAKDYIDLAALIEHGVPLARAMSAARAMYGPAFEPSITLKAMTWFKGGDMASLDAESRKVLLRSVDAFHGRLPTVEKASDQLLLDAGSQ
ncbi:MAG: nucleotidyl transferase AbiEii/AbiGii toxin family protein [Xanthomonadales bacterium]|nr:nucleotidyl transferase AbiEii/AbiGii toxin family protein [Xanthomonadales bacterium]